MVENQCQVYIPQGNISSKELLCWVSYQLYVAQVKILFFYLRSLRIKEVIG